MSDLTRISTPSQTRSAVSNDAFEVLIDLLTSDGIDENPSNLRGNRTRPQADVSLRDSSGKLDFDKIRLMFTSQNAQKPLGEEKTRVQSVRSPTPPNDEDESDDEHHSYRSTSSTIPSRSNSTSPQPIKHANRGHIRSSTFGSQPWAAIHGNATEVKAQDALPTLLDQPLSFDELNAALAGAHEEVRSLRRQYDELQAMISKGLVSETRDPVKFSQSTMNTDKANGNTKIRDAGSQARPSTVVSPIPLSPDVPTEIAGLSENEAKAALSALVCSLNLSLSAVGSVGNLLTPGAFVSPQQGLSPLNSARQHDVASITRALKFLGTVDELVWRRTSAPSGPRMLLPIYSEENVVALLARLELWERAVRRSTRF